MKKNNILSTTQWILIGSIVISLIGIYYKREELKAQAKAVFSEKKMPEPEPDPAPRATAKTFKTDGLKIFSFFHLNFCMFL